MLGTRYSVAPVDTTEKGLVLAILRKKNFAFAFKLDFVGINIPGNIEHITRAKNYE